MTNYNNISSKFEKLFKEIRNNLKYKKNNFHILSKNFEINFSNKDLKKMSNFKSLAILGMGGSILGTEAIYQFLEKKIKKKVVFFNDLNEEKIVNFKKTNKFNKVLFVVVSKSGNTLETLSNFIALNIIKKH